MSLLAKHGLKVVKVLIQKHLGYKIAWYDMILNVSANKIDFEVPSMEAIINPFQSNKKRRYPYEDKSALMNIIKAMVAKKLTTKDVLDIIIIKWHETKDVLVDVYFRDETGTKQFKQITL